MLFASDRRFQPLHQEYSEDWGLRILSVRLSDAGWYFCQISASPPISHYLYLNVVGEYSALSEYDYQNTANFSKVCFRVSVSHWAILSHWLYYLWISL